MGFRADQGVILPNFGAVASTTMEKRRCLNFWATVCKTVRPILSHRCLSVCLSCLFVTLVYCGQTVGWIKMKLDMRVGLGPGHIMLDGDPAPLPKMGQSPQFSAHICYGQMAGWTKMPLGREVGLSPSDIVVDETQISLPQKGRSPQFSAQFYCGQTAGRIKMPLGTEIDLSPGHVVLDRDPAPAPPRERSTAAPSLFSAHVY